MISKKTEYTTIGSQRLLPDFSNKSIWNTHLKFSNEVILPSLITF